MIDNYPKHYFKQKSPLLPYIQSDKGNYITQKMLSEYEIKTSGKRWIIKFLMVSA